MNGWSIDHVAIVVKDLDAALDLYRGTLGFEQVYREIVADQGIEAVGLRAGGSVIELLRPLSDDSPVARFRGDAETKLHHTAYRVADIAAELARLKAARRAADRRDAAQGRARKYDRVPAPEKYGRRTGRVVPAGSTAERSPPRRCERMRLPPPAARSAV